MIDIREIRHGHIACGIAGGAKGFNQGEARIGNMRAKFRCIGGIDVDPAVIRDFGRLAGTAGTVLDLFTLEQYCKFHGRMPPAGWRQAQPADIHHSFGHEHPHIIFASFPCKGFSGLLSQARSLTDKYQALNELVLHGMMLTLEAYKDDPVEFYLLENVPRIATRGRHLLDQIEQLLSAYGYASAETTHDCGELGGLAQSRKRFLLVARHTEKVPPFLYEPSKRPLRAVGDVLGRMQLPGDPSAGPMHRIPALHWKTWVRLAFVQAGKDWRSLQDLRVVDGVLKDFALVPEGCFNDGYGVRAWGDSSGVVTSDARPSKGAFSVADPRMAQSAEYSQLGIRGWDKPIGAVSGQSTVGGGAYAVADPRVDGVKHNNCFRVVRWSDVSPSVTGGAGPSAGGLAVADPRAAKHASELHGKYHVTPYEDHSRAVIAGRDNGGCYVADPRYNWAGAHENKMRVSEWDEPSRVITGSDRVGSGALSVADPRPANGWTGGGKYRVTTLAEPAGTVIAESGTGNGAFAVADPRPPKCPAAKYSRANDYQTSGSYGVVPWDRSAGAVSAKMSHDNSYASVADPRLPSPSDRLVAFIRSMDNTWHRPFTTLELAALQGLLEPGEDFALDGVSDSAWRERIGNAVPPPAAKAIASEIGRTLLLAWSGETFALGSTPIWVRPIAIALSVMQRRPT